MGYAWSGPCTDCTILSWHGAAKHHTPFYAELVHQGVHQMLHGQDWPWSILVMNEHLNVSAMIATDPTQRAALPGSLSFLE